MTAEQRFENWQRFAGPLRGVKPEIRRDNVLVLRGRKWVYPVSETDRALARTARRVIWDLETKHSRNADSGK